MVAASRKPENASCSKGAEGGSTVNSDINKDEDLMSCNSNDEFNDTMSDSSRTGFDDSTFVAEAQSNKEEGNEALKRKNYPEACELYRKGLKNLGKCLNKSDTEYITLEKALNLNLSLACFKSNLAFEGMRAASEVLTKDPQNIKGLFRRGMCRVQLGLLDDAKADFEAVLSVNPNDLEAKNELVKVKRRIAEVAKQEKAAYSSLFQKTSGLYADRAEEAKERAKAEEARVSALKTTWEEETASLPESDRPSFDDWMRKRDEAEKEKKNKEKKPETPKTQEDTKPLDAAGASPSSKSESKASNISGMDSMDVDYDEEEMKVLRETKAKGYCYFRRDLTREEQAARMKNLPQKITSTADKPMEAEAVTVSKKGVSDWNASGTTYEEKNTTSWCIEKLQKRLKTVQWKSEAYDTDLNAMMADPKKFSELLAIMDPAKTDVTNDSIMDSLSKLQPISAKVVNNPDVSGEAQMVVLKGSKRYLYDFKLKLDWEIEIGVMMGGSEKSVYTGQLKVDDVDDAGSPQSKWFVPCSIIHKKSISDKDKTAFDLAIQGLKKALVAAMKSFEQEYQSMQ